MPTGVTATPETLEESCERLGSPRESGGCATPWPARKPLSPEAHAELAERIKAERPGYRLGDQVHGPWCELIHAENRWWQVFCAALPYWQSSAGDAPQPSVAAANEADYAIAEAKKRGRL